MQTDAILTTQDFAPPDTRTEADSAGAVTLPADALFGIESERARRLAVSGVRPHPALVDAMLWIKRAAALAHRESGRLEGAAADAVIHAADEMLGGAHRDQVVVDALHDGAGVALNMNCNEVLANRANELLGAARGTYMPVDPRRHVGLNESSREVLADAIRLGVLALLEPLTASIDETIGAAKRDGDALAVALSRDRATIMRAADPLRSLGGGMGERRIVGHLRRLTRLDLREAIPPTDVMDDLVACAAALRRYADDLATLAERRASVRLEVTDRDWAAVAAVDAVRQVCCQVVGCDAAAAAAAERGGALPLAAHNVLYAMEILTGASRLLARVARRS